MFFSMKMRLTENAYPLAAHAATDIALEGAFPTALAAFAARIVFGNLASPRTRLLRPRHTCALRVGGEEHRQ